MMSTRTAYVGAHASAVPQVVSSLSLSLPLSLYIYIYIYLSPSLCLPNTLEIALVHMCNRTLSLKLRVISHALSVCTMLSGVSSFKGECAHPGFPGRGNPPWEWCWSEEG